MKKNKKKYKKKIRNNYYINQLYYIHINQFKICKYINIYILFFSFFFFLNWKYSFIINIFFSLYIFIIYNIKFSFHKIYF